MTGVDILLFGILLTCFLLGTQVTRPKTEKPTKTPEKEFSEALEKLLTAGINVKIVEPKKDK